MMLMMVHHVCAPRTTFKSLLPLPLCHPITGMYSSSLTTVASPVLGKVAKILYGDWCWQLIEKITRMQQYNFNQEDTRIAITTKKQSCDKIKCSFAYGKLVNLSFCVDLIPPSRLLFPPEGSNIDFTGRQY